MIEEFITTYIKSKLKEFPSLVLYDGEHLYIDLLTALKAEGITIFDISESILSVREDALDFYNQVLPANKDARMIVYVPFPPPETKQEKIDDPFFIFTFGGSYFPYDANDKYESLCKACFKDKEEKITVLFEQEIPDFETINALGGGNTWAKLQTLTGGKSEKEILGVIMAPTSSQLENLKKDKTWQKEYKDVAKTIGLVPKEKSFDGITYELWRFILFSEFVFDLPIDLPASLKLISVAKPSAKQTVIEICKALRNNKTSEEVYISMAEQVASELELPSIFKNESNLGEIITFSFEDNTYFYHCIQLLIEGKNAEANSIILTSKDNIWLHHDEERRRYWRLADIGHQIILKSKSSNSTITTLKACIENYTTEGYKIDQLQRKFEKEQMEVLQPNEALIQLVKLVRGSYNSITEKNQKVYQQLLENENWPVAGMSTNSEVFTKYIQPLRKSNTKTAFLLIDALRFELGKELEEQLIKHFNISLIPSCAYLPTVTKFGMAALLPDAEKDLHLEDYQGSLEAFMGDKQLLTLANRRNYLKEKLGDRCEIISMDKLISTSAFDPIDLLIVTTSEIDTAGENLTSNSIHAMHQAVQNLVKSIYLLSQNGFDKIIIATDHGFVLHPIFQAGDNVSKPAGEWIMTKSRSLAGLGAIPDSAIGFTAQQLGIKTKVKDFVFLKGFAVFEKNTNYFHEGLSLQENVVPVMVISKIVVKKEDQLVVNLTYKGKNTGCITSRRPSFEIATFLEGKIGFDPIVLRMEAISGTQLVGKPATDEKVNETTKFIEILPGQSCRIAMDMDVDFEGEFEVRITDPVSNKLFSSINISTDYIT